MGFLFLGPVDLMKCSQRTNVKEKSREQQLTGTEVARKITKENERGLKKGGENGTEQCQSNNGTEQCRASQAERGWNNTEQYCEAEKELEKVDEILGKLAQRTTKIPKLIPLTTFVYSRARTVT